MVNNGRLFSDANLHESIEERRRTLRLKIRGVPIGQLRTNRKTVEEKLAKEFACRVPRLKENDVSVERAGMPSSDKIKVLVRVPFDGDASWFGKQPPHSDRGVPGDVRVEKSELVFPIISDVSKPESFQADLKRYLEAIASNLSNIEKETAPFRDALQRTIVETLDLRLAETGNADDFMSKIGYPEKIPK